MKISKYVKKVSYNDEMIILHNCYNGALYLIDKASLKEIEEGFENKHSDKLMEECFLVKKENIPTIIRSNDYVSIVLELSNVCNLSCRYCYENDKGTRGRISKEVIASSLKYIENVMKIDSENRTIGIRFIGGEPLLEKDILLQIYKEVVRLGKKYNHEVDFSIDTNGTIEFADLYEQMDQTAFFVSLTNKEDHNKNRPSDSFNSFDRIVQNLKQIKNIKDGNYVGIRYNTNSENINFFSEFVAFVRRELPCVEEIKPMYTDEYEYNSFKNGISLEEYKKWNSSAAIDILAINGFKTKLSIGGPLSLCDAYEKYSCKIYLDGKITLCDSLFHNTSSITIFDVCDEPANLEKHFSEYRNFNPMQDDECKGCVDVARCAGKLVCREKPCNYNKKYDEKIFLKKYVDYCLNGRQEVFLKM